jgi:hypothetical protein
MDISASPGPRAAVPVLFALLLSACGSVELPGFLKGGAKGEPANGQEGPQAGKDNFDLHPKEITSVAPMASVMLEKQCPNIVQPYRVTDSMASLGLFSAREGLPGLENALAGAMRTGHLGAGGQAGIPPSTKLAAKQLNWLPMEVETKYGERAHHQETALLDRDSRIGKKYYPVADKMLAEILAQVGQPYDYQFKLFILKSSDHNALSRPGGYLYIDKGLLDSPERYPKAYFAIAHEIAHVLQRHETFELQSMIVDSFSEGADMQKTIAAAGVNPDAVLARAKSGKHVFIRHHIDQELQADSCATRLLSRVFPDRAELEKSLTAFLKDLPKPDPAPATPAPKSDADRLAASVHEVVDTPIMVHPNSAEREANLRAMYAAVASTVAAAPIPPQQ